MNAERFTAVIAELIQNPEVPPAQRAAFLALCAITGASEEMAVRIFTAANPGERKLVL
jgi:hypothetical protein